MIFGNPIRGTVHDEDWKRPPGNHEFMVTQDFGPSPIAAEPTIVWPGGEGVPAGTYPNFHPAIDIGNKREGDDVIAARAGTVIYAGVQSPGGINVWIDHGGGWITGNAHLANRTVSDGDAVAAGRLIGHVGTTNGTFPDVAAHLHFAVKSDFPKGGFLFSSGKWHNPWLYLAQNQPKTVHPNGPGINIRVGPSTGSAIFASTRTDGHIRNSNGTDLGLTQAPRKFGGFVAGGPWTLPSGSGNLWAKIWLGNAYRFIAKPLVTVG